MSDAVHAMIGQSKLLRIHLNSVQRVLLYIAASVWFMVYILSQQRNYQDSWILEDILWPFIGLMMLCFYVISVEKDNRIVALLCAWTILILTLVPSLKYEQPYGASPDATEHYLMVQELMTHGKVLESHIYASIPAMHSWLASLGITSGLSEESTIQLGLPLTGMLMPLLIYWWLHATGVPEDIIKYTIAASCLSVFQYYLPNGTSFTLVPLIMLLAVIFIREYRAFVVKDRLSLTIVAIIGLLQITFWHSTTPFLLPLVLAGTTLTPLLTAFMLNSGLSLNFAKSFARLALLSIILFFGYRMLRDDRIFQVIVTMVVGMFDTSESVKPAAPPKMAQVTLVGVAKTTWLIRGRFLVLASLTALGVVVIWWNRSKLREVLALYIYVIVIIAIFFSILAGAFVTGITYGRFLFLLLALSPFFVGPFLWWVRHKFLARFIKSRPLLLLSYTVVVIVLCALVLIDFYPLQPIVPNIRDPKTGEAKDSLLWVHTVNTAQQKHMITFAENSAPENSRFAIDLLGQRQFIRYFGEKTGARRRLYLPLRLREDFESKKFDLFLLHWPGPAGGLSEPVGLRSFSRIREIREAPDWGVIYDNGESFIIWVP